MERNPVRAGWWSGQKTILGRVRRPIAEGATTGVLSAEFPPPGVIEDWSEWLYAGCDKDEAHAYIRSQTRTGRPCGSSRFINQLESLLARTLRPIKGGRPRKEKNA